MISQLSSGVSRHRVRLSLLSMTIAFVSGHGKSLGEVSFWKCCCVEILKIPDFSELFTE